MHLRWLLGSACVMLGACYSPELRDCTVTCTASTDCAADQVCDGAGFCAAPEVAGSCETGSGAIPKVSLRVSILGGGMIQVTGVGACTSDCTWMVDNGTPVQLVVVKPPDFDKWTTPNCKNPSTSCTLPMTASAIVGAKFKH
jgi:hypothetical protein